MKNIFLPIGVVMFALLGFSSVPELKMEIKGQEEKLKKAIIFGSLIPIAIYIIFTFTFIGVLGTNVPEVATLGFGKFITLLGVFTMLTSYFVLSFALKDMYHYDFKYSKKKRFLLVSILPIAIYLLITRFNLLSFTSVLGIGGVISGGITGMMILITNRKAKQKGDRKPEYQIPINWLIIAIISLFLIAGVVLELIL